MSQEVASGGFHSRLKPVWAAWCVQARSVEQKVMDHPAYKDICAKDAEGGGRDANGCLLPFSFATLVYTTEETLLTGDFQIGDTCGPL